MAGFDCLGSKSIRVKGVRLIPETSMPLNGVDRDVGRTACPDQFSPEAHVAGRSAHHHRSGWVEAHGLKDNLPCVRQRLNVPLSKHTPLRHRLNLLDDALLDLRMEAQQVEGPGQGQSRGFVTGRDEREDVVDHITVAHGPTRLRVGGLEQTGDQVGVRLVTVATLGDNPRHLAPKIVPRPLGPASPRVGHPAWGPQQDERSRPAGCVEIVREGLLDAADICPALAGEHGLSNDVEGGVHHLLRDIHLLANTGQPQRSAAATIAGTKPRIWSGRKIGAAAWRCQRQRAPSAVRTASPSSGWSARRRDSALTNASAWSTSTCRISSGSMTNTISRPRNRERYSGCS